MSKPYNPWFIHSDWPEPPRKREPEPISERGTRHPNVRWGNAFIPHRKRMPATRLPEPFEPEWAVLLCWTFVAMAGAYLLYQGAAFAVETYLRGGWR